MPQIVAIALGKVARTSPTLPPSAIRTLAILERMPAAGQHHADILEDRGDRRMRLVHGDLDGADARKGSQYRIRHRPGGTFEELVIGTPESGRRGGHHIGIGHGIGETIGAGGLRQVRIQFEVDHEALADLGLVLHHAVAGMDHDAGDEDRIRHCLSSMAAATRSACTVSATSWVRMIRAPRWAARRCAAIDPPRRCCGSDGETEAMKTFREAPTRSGRPNTSSSESCASTTRLCSCVLPKPMPGSSTMFSLAMPARAAISSERVKKAAISAMMSMPGSARSRLCITITGALRAAIVPAMAPSRCRPQTSLAITAPWSRAQAMTSAFMLSMETGTPSATMAASTGCKRRNSMSAETGCAPP